MKRIAYLVFLAALGGAGCVTLPFFGEEKKPPPAEVKPQEPPAVTADEITNQNAAERARALQAELEFESKTKPKTP